LTGIGIQIDAWYEVCSLTMEGAPAVFGSAALIPLTRWCMKIPIGSLALLAPLAAGAMSAAGDPAMAQAAPFEAAYRVSGPMPGLPGPDVVGWIVETLDVSVDAAGVVRQVEPLRHTPAPADLLTPAITQWRFQPAIDEGRAVPSHVLVAAMFRPPQEFDAPTLGEPSSAVGSPSPDVAFPLQTPSPLYPPMAAADSVVVVEVTVDRNGQVREAKAICGDPAFGRPSLDAARRWLFRPAERGGRPVESMAYIVFGFRRPLAPSRAP
jgi:TonB family protein